MVLKIRIPIYEKITEEKLKAILPPGYYAKAEKEFNRYNILCVRDRDYAGTIEVKEAEIIIIFFNITQADKYFVDAWSEMHPHHDPRSRRDRCCKVE